MLIIIIAIFFALGVIVKTYGHIDHNEVTRKDVIKAAVPAVIAVLCLILREGYFSLPDDTMVSTEFLNYRKILLWGFLGLMGYILRALTYGSVYFYRGRN